MLAVDPLTGRLGMVETVVITSQCVSESVAKCLMTEVYWEALGNG